MAKAAGSSLSWGLVAGLGLVAIAQPGGCGAAGPNGSVPPEVQDAMTGMLEDAWPEVVGPALDRAEAESSALLVAVQAWAASSGDDTARAEAQDAWFAAMDAWQEVEVMQLGPAGSTITETVGGEDLRDEVYSWPTVNRCLVDQETVAAEWTSSDFFTVNLVNSYGLDALEVLLFSPEGVNDCPTQAEINSGGSWDALGVDGVQQNRADYAVVAAQGVVDTIDLIEARWTDSFAAELATAGGGGLFETQEQAVNAIFDAMFYLESETKDRKLGGPLGEWECGAASCPGTLETTLAGGSNLWIAANLRGFRAWFTGNDGAGLEDLLRSLGHDDVADQVLVALDEADAAAAALTSPIGVAIEAGDPAAMALYVELKGVTDLLKEDIATLLALQIPSEAAGDND